MSDRFLGLRTETISVSLPLLVSPTSLPLLAETVVRCLGISLNVAESPPPLPSPAPPIFSCSLLSPPPLPIFVMHHPLPPLALS